MKPFFILSFLSILLITSLNITPQQIEGDEFHVIPQAYSGIVGTAGFLGPLSNGNRSYQLLIHQDLLVDLLNKEISGLSWRILASATAAWPPVEVIYDNYDIYLSESVAPANRSLTLANNVVGVQTLVRFGSLTISAGAYTSGSSPNEWGPEISFDTPYLYTGSHLLIELRHTTNPSTNQSVDALSTSTSGYGTLFSACWQSSYTPTVGLQGNFCIVRLTADDPVPVELTSFTASVSGNSIQLNWATASEINNYGFEVERKSADSEFEAVGFVPGFGSTTETKNYSFVDSKISNGTYVYRLKQIDFDGSFEYSYEVELDFTSPSVYSLEQNYPNPFNPSTSINFNLAEASLVKLSVYNLLGEELINVLNETREAGAHTVIFDASTLTSGVYFYKLETPQFKQTRKMILAK